MKTKTENNSHITPEEIANLAQRIWEQEGRQPGRDLDYWLRAERQILSSWSRASNVRLKPSKTGAAESLGPRKAIGLPGSVVRMVHTT
jgi:hypothetical protein